VILDTSAILAVILREPEGNDFLTKIGAATAVGIGAPTLVETSVILAARVGEAGSHRLARLVERTDTVVVAFEPGHWQVAFDAWMRFGKGRHTAGLNFGDCLSYAVARMAAEPLLCKGDDFAKTDIELA
jgi:ribonuclease VapC